MPMFMGPEGLLAFRRLPEAIDTGTGWPSRVAAQPVPSLAPLSLDATGADAAALAAATLAMTGMSDTSGESDAARDRAITPAIAALFSVIAEARAVSHPGFVQVSADDLRAGIARVYDAHLVYREPEPPRARAAS